ncbi:MAG: hypothetical protein FJ146_03175 [Deltaproteobacteria bacterium]|nr:hypothetical protein [Deltaproteobacteria bacterium]
MTVRRKRRGQLATSTLASVLVSTVVAPQSNAAPKVGLKDLTAWPEMSVRDFLDRVGLKRSGKINHEVIEPKVSNTPTVANGGITEVAVVAAADGLKFNPAQIEFSGPGDKLRLNVAPGLGDLALFVRDEKILELRRELGQLAALKPGATELYAFSKGRMYIVPVWIRGGAGAKHFEMRVPDGLFNLTGVLPALASSAKFDPKTSDVSSSEEQEPQSQSGRQLPETEAPDDREQVKNDQSDVLKTPSLSASVAATKASMAEHDRERIRYYYGRSEVAYQTVTIQIVDDRSDVAAGKIYPVIGATVRVVGTDFVGQTDATGHLTIKDMPKNSRFLVQIDDPSSQVRSSIAEIMSDGKGVRRLKMLRSLIFDGLSAIASTVQKSGLGSYCATIAERTEAGADKPQGGLSIKFDTPAEGPYYFNRFGYLDRGLSQTGEDGRVCFFNVTPGPAAISLSRGNEVLMTQPVAVFVGNHTEDGVSISDQKKIAVQLASMATAQEQLGNDAQAANSFKQVDAVDIIPFGDDMPMMQVEAGRLASQDPVTHSHGRFHFYARAAEFEPVVYTYPTDESPKILPLIPRGFIEDMSLYAQVAHDPTQGAVLVHYSAPAAVARDTVSMRLIDQNGRDVGDGWYFSDAPLTKAVFFNVPAGTYNLQVQTRDGYWLSSDTVVVYNETTSFVQLGGALKAR